MILAFLANLNIRPQKAQYLDTFYKMIKAYNKDDVHYVITREYLERYEDSWAHNNIIKHEDINFDELNYTIIPNPCEQRAGIPLTKKLQSYNREYNGMLEQYLQYDIETKKPIDYIVTWINNYTLKNFAQKNNIPIIHNELGALRPNLWKDSIYLDFSGVNHNTEFQTRLYKFMDIADQLPLLTREELITLVARDKSTALNIYHNYFNRTDCDNIGVALQVARDSNLLMYSNGWNTIDIITYACDRYGKKNLLIKNHPFSDLQQIGDFRFVNTPEELLMRSKKVVTINSSMAFEALLLGKEAEIMGSNPFEHVMYRNEEDRIKALNFAVISYLVPAKLLFNKEYYKFRIECKDELTLFRKGLINWSNSGIL